MIKLVPILPEKFVTPAVKVRPVPVSMVIEKTSGAAYVIDLEYPQSSEDSLPEIKQNIDKIKSDFFGFIPPNGQERGYSMTMRTSVFTSSSTITYKIETYRDTGGAHGNISETTFTYDEQGTFTSLDDILSSSKSLDTLSTLSRTYFYKKLGEGQKEVIDRGTDPTRENFDTWYITDDGITFVFQQYQVGAYTIGVQEFLISRSVVSGIFNI